MNPYSYKKLHNYLKHVYKIGDRLVVKIFISFLVEHNVLKSFNRQLGNNRTFDPCRRSYGNLICDAFTWVHTREGYAYWDRLNSLWKDRFFNLKNGLH